MKRIRAIATDEITAVSAIVTELVALVLAHKKKAALVIVIELWIHSLTFQHLAELKHLYELIPFIH